MQHRKELFFSWNEKPDVDVEQINSMYKFVDEKC
jgi:hypothetical protein